MNRPDMDEIQEYIKTFERPSCDQSLAMYKYILELEAENEKLMNCKSCSCDSKHMSTIDYLYANTLSITTAIWFTSNDLDYLKRTGVSFIIINGNKPTKEELDEVDILCRLDDLRKLDKIVKGIKG